MRLTGVHAGSQDSRPGVTGTARVDRRIADLLRRVGPGDIAVLDQVDLDRATADALVAADVAAVVNASPSISGRFPNLGPEVLLEAGIPLVDAVGDDVLHDIRDGTRVRLHDGVLYAGEREVASGVLLTPETVADQMVEARAGMSAQLEAFSADTIEFLRRERDLILDGVGVPQLDVPMRGREVLVVAPGHDHAADLAGLRRYLAENRPVLIGVGAAADTLVSAGYQPHVLVGEPEALSVKALRTGAEVVVPAHPDGHAPGLERIQDLGIAPVTFPASGNTEDLALLLADAHEASLVVTVGFQATLREFLDQGRSGSNPSTFLTRLRLGGKLVDGKAAAVLHGSRISTRVVWLLVLASLVALCAALAVSGLGRVYLSAAVDACLHVLTWVKGVFS